MFVKDERYRGQVTVEDSDSEETVCDEEPKSKKEEVSMETPQTHLYIAMTNIQFLPVQHGCFVCDIFNRSRFISNRQ
ncbi:hypothetical protein O3G_MSEX001018 [Manduca sexta]|nr:hypothetical protein O3G_MSEX001018 [Manduca sexta]KAG6439719.1 hypothetical protein O3G_MSEX001018 [Manduca sexta]